MAVSTAWRAIPAARPSVKESPCAWSAIATAPEVMPKLPGVSGRALATSRAATRTIAATSGWPIPSEARIAVAAVRRAGREEGPGREAERPARVEADGAEDVEQVRDAVAGLVPAGREGDADHGNDEPDGDQQRPERHDSGGRAGDHESA